MPVVALRHPPAVVAVVAPGAVVQLDSPKEIAEMHLSLGWDGNREGLLNLLSAFLKKLTCLRGVDQYFASDIGFPSSVLDILPGVNNCPSPRLPDANRLAGRQFQSRFCHSHPLVELMNNVVASALISAGSTMSPNWR